MDFAIGHIGHIGHVGQVGQIIGLTQTNTTKPLPAAKGYMAAGSDTSGNSGCHHRLHVDIAMDWKKPTIRTYGMLCRYFTGKLDLEELLNHISKLQNQD